MNIELGFPTGGIELAKISSVSDKKCGGKVFFVDEITTQLEVDGEIDKQLSGGDLHNRNCVRCNYPVRHKDNKHLDN
jgi:hypothetical protein